MLCVWNLLFTLAVDVEKNEQNLKLASINEYWTKMKWKVE